MVSKIFFYLRKLTLILILGFVLTIFYSFLNHNYILAACPTGYHAISYGPDEFCVNTEQPLPPCRPGDEETVVGQTRQCTTPEVDPCPSFVSFNPEGNQFTPDQQIGIIFQPPTEAGHNVLEYDLRLNTQDRRVEIIPVTLNSTLLWTATVGPLPVSSQNYSLHLEKSSPPQKDCGTFSFSVVNIVSGRNPCYRDIDGDGIIDCETAFGPISTNITAFAGRVLEIAIGLAGGIALILLVFGSIRVLTSSGDQQKLSGGRDTIVAAIAGLLFLIFSVLILRALGLVVGVPFA